MDFWYFETSRQKPEIAQNSVCFSFSPMPAVNTDATVCHSLIPRVCSDFDFLTVSSTSTYPPESAFFSLFREPANLLIKRELRAAQRHKAQLEWSCVVEYLFHALRVRTALLNGPPDILHTLRSPLTTHKSRGTTFFMAPQRTDAKSYRAARNSPFGQTKSQLRALLKKKPIAGNITNSVCAKSKSCQNLQNNVSTSLLR